MEVKSYFATTVEAAVQLASQEMGSEAMLVTSRRTPAETAHLGRYEVVFARDKDSESQAPAPRMKTPNVPSTPALHPPRPTVAPLAAAAAAGARATSMRFAVAPRKIMGQPVATAHTEELSFDVTSHALSTLNEPLRTDFASMLDAQGISRPDSRQFFDSFPERHRNPGEPRFTVTSRIARLAGELNCRPGMARSVALVGPPGVGKTTTLIKLAIMQGLAAGIPVRLFSMDCVRIGAADQLRAFAELLGMSFQSFETFAELSHRLTNSRHDGLTLIDTAGYSRSNYDEVLELGACLEQHADVECQLVLRADRKTNDNLGAIKRFELCRPARLILTGIDETQDLSDLADFLAAQPLPLSFLGFGQRIPEDLEPATAERVAELIVCGWEGESRNIA